jgi:hypothetical protein
MSDMPSPTTLVAALLVALLLPSAALSGQIGTGQVNGTITDPQGAFVAGAAVKLVNRDANLATQLPTDPSLNGQFNRSVKYFIDRVINIDRQGNQPARTAGRVLQPSEGVELCGSGNDSRVGGRRRNLLGCSAAGADAAWLEVLIPAAGSRED